MVFRIEKLKNTLTQLRITALYLYFSNIIHFIGTIRDCLLHAILLLLALTVLYATNFEVKAKPPLYDPTLQVELIIKDIKFATSMAYLGPEDILVLEKNEGTVPRIVNGNMLAEPLLET